MKTLILLRHAEAAPATDDHARELTGYGETQAWQTGNWLHDSAYRPDFYLCSTAMRTRQTLMGVLEAAGLDNVTGEMAEALYNRHPAHYLQTVNEAGRGDTLLLVGHNHDICRLALDLSDRRNATLALRLIEANFPPATMAVLTADIENWSDLRERGASLVDLFMPV